MTTVVAHIPPRETAVRQTVEFTEANRGWVLAAPAVVCLAILIFAPVLVVFGLSLTDYNLGATEWRGVGLKNYADLFQDPNVLASFKHTAIYVAIVVPGSVGLGLLVACLIQQRVHLRRAYEIIFFLPVTSTFVAMALVWQFLLHGRIGPINEWLVAIGLPRMDFLTDPSLALITLAGIGIWQLVGQTTILFLSGLVSIPQDIYDAAALDGMDSGWDRFIRVTFPLLAPTTLFVLVTTTITAFQVFDSVASLTRGGPGNATRTILYEIYLEAYRYSNTGFSASLAMIFLLVIGVFSVVQLVVIDRRVHY
ncbi:MAG: sugar ABC transporter permease [Hyphomicrobiales bacterium]|nr:sugar ABC transporter permease [Hyphomicrobiales bacterium]